MRENGAKEPKSFTERIKTSILKNGTGEWYSTQIS